ncbi:MAG: hypothetical protein KC561_08910 [Myxococcales bacterium]|nr:hypothetical protein [Myxococcales bacterium]
MKSLLLSILLLSLPVSRAAVAQYEIDFDDVLIGWYLTLDEFAEIVEVAALSKGGDPPSRDAVESTFRAMDSDGSGVLDTEEVEASIESPENCSGRGFRVLGRPFLLLWRVNRN